MAVHQKLSEIGWIYHAPRGRVNMDPVLAPPPSQIPGLSDLSDVPPEAPPRVLFRDTDTKYVRLAKMGGRPGLLEMKDFVPKTKEAQLYPRSNWFYLEDNAVEEAALKANQQDWTFRLPEYMVHEEFKPSEHDVTPPINGRVPHGQQRSEDARLNAEAIEKLKASRLPSMLKASQSGKAKKHHETTHSKYPVPPPLYDVKERPAMSKLLSYGYMNDWKQVRDNWYTTDQPKRAIAEEVKHEVIPAEPDKIIPNSKALSAPTHGSGKAKQQLQDLSKVNSKDDAPKVPFELSRFTKAKAKVDTNRNIQELTTVS